jgi:hypothetical protein
VRTRQGLVDTLDPDLTQPLALQAGDADSAHVWDVVVTGQGDLVPLPL